MTSSEAFKAWWKSFPERFSHQKNHVSTLKNWVPKFADRIDELRRQPLSVDLYQWLESVGLLTILRCEE